MWKRVLITSTVCLTFLVGCGGPVVPIGPQAQVSGGVTNNEKPGMLGSQVVFYHAGKGLTLAAALDAQGKYALTPGDPKVGIPVGSYTVTILPPLDSIVQESPTSADYQKSMQAGKVPATVSAKSSKDSDIPEKFRDAKTSGLVLEIKEGVNTFDFDLSK